jgi:hypothetical protein
LEEKVRCQSCGMPLSEEFFGTRADGMPCPEYCKFCYRKGKFTDPDLSLEGMVEKSVYHMTALLGMPEERALELAKKVIPELGRWKENK